MMLSPRYIYVCLRNAVKATVKGILTTGIFTIKWAVGVLILRKRPIVVERASMGIGDLICLMGPVYTLRKRQFGNFVIVIVQGSRLELVQATEAADIALPIGSFAAGLAKRLTSPNNFHKAYLPDELSPPQVREKIHLSSEFAKCLNVESSLESVTIKIPFRIMEAMYYAVLEINPEGLPVIVVHTGPTWPVKEWPASHWGELSRRIKSELNVVLIQIGADVDSWGGESRQAIRVPICIDWVGKLNLLQTAAILDQATLFVGCDSGPLHMATTIGTRTIALFGPTDGKCFIHPRAKTTILTANVTCLGCHHAKNGPTHWRTGCPYDIKCMKEISVEEVFVQVVAVVGKGPAADK